MVAPIGVALGFAIAAPDVTQLGKVCASSPFRFSETYSAVAYIHIVLTISPSLGVRALDKRRRRSPRG